MDLSVPHIINCELRASLFGLYSARLIQWRVHTHPQRHTHISASWSPGYTSVHPGDNIITRHSYTS